MAFKNRFILFILLIPFSLFSSQHQSKAQLTFIYNFGRIGDVFIDIARNMYLADKYNLELCINDRIPYTQHFTIDKIWGAKSLNKKKKIIYRESELSFARNNVVYISHRHTVFNDISDYEGFDDFLFRHYLENESFRKKVQHQLSLKQTFELPHIPTDHLSIAIHVRKGSGFDYPLLSPQYKQAYSDVGFPTKFPPEQYFIDQIQFLKKVLSQKPLYIRVFTDDKKPYELIHRMQERLGPDILLHYISPSSEVEDIYAMSKFDILIKPVSAFSATAQMIGINKIIITPTKYQWEENYLHITESKLLLPDRKNGRLISVPITQNNTEEIKSLLSAVENL